MSNIDKRALREAAEKALNARERLALMESVFEDDGDDVKPEAQEDISICISFNELTNPATVLALLDELEAKDKQIGDLKATAAHSNAGWKEAHEQEARAEAAEKRIAELERKEQHSERQSVIDALAGSGEEWSDIEEYMQKWDAERASAAGKGE
ncbi:TPA: ead/Ea22-like family protein [Enterobacter asburiae]